MFASSLLPSGPRVRVMVVLPTSSVSCRFLLLSVLISVRMVDTLTDLVSDGERKKSTIIRTMASNITSQIKLVLSHFPLLDIGIPLYYGAGSLPTAKYPIH